MIPAPSGKRLARCSGAARRNKPSTAPAFGELYHANGSGPCQGYDGFNQLTAFTRGKLSASVSGGVPDTVATPASLPGSSQSWTLDAQGNWKTVTTDGVTQTRTSNQDNQIQAEAQANPQAPAAKPLYDLNDNTTQDDQGHTLVYDAWNRLVAVNRGQTFPESFAYDALGGRMSEREPFFQHELYLDRAGQVLQEVVNGNLYAEYVWRAAGVDTLVERDRDPAQRQPAERAGVRAAGRHGQRHRPGERQRDGTGARRGKWGGKWGHRKSATRSRHCYCVTLRSNDGTCRSAGSFLPGPAWPATASSEAPGTT